MSTKVRSKFQARFNISPSKVNKRSTRAEPGLNLSAGQVNCLLVIRHIMPLFTDVSFLLISLDNS